MEPIRRKVVIRRRNYSKGEEALSMQAAYQEATDSSSPNVKSIAEKYDVSRKSLDARVKGDVHLNASPGKKSILDQDEEAFLTSFLIEMSAMGFGYSSDAIKKLLRTILNKDVSALTNGWISHFLAKHPEIATRRTEAIDRLRLRAIDEEKVSFYFLTLEMAFLKCQQLSQGAALSPARIFAMDETGLHPNLKQNYVLAARGSRSVYCLTSESREHLTIVAHASADGASGRPYFILPRNIKNFLGNCFEGSKVGHSSSGYMNDQLFEDWCEFFVDEIRSTRPACHLWCLLVLDGLHSHTLNPKALQILNSANILAVCLPSHTSAFLQVHDITIFGPLKKYFRSSMSGYTKQNGLAVKIENLPEILEEPWVLANNQLNVKKGFNKAGIWPLNRDWVRDNLASIALYQKKDKESQFEDLTNLRIANSEMDELVKRLSYLNLSSQSNNKNSSTSKPNNSVFKEEFVDNISKY